MSIEPTHQSALILTAIQIALDAVNAYPGNSCPKTMAVEVDSARYAIGIAFGSQKGNIMLELRKVVIQTLELHQCGMILEPLEEMGIHDKRPDH